MRISRKDWEVIEAVKLPLAKALFDRSLDGSQLTWSEASPRMVGRFMHAAERMAPLLVLYLKASGRRIGEGRESRFLDSAFVVMGFILAWEAVWREDYRLLLGTAIVAPVVVLLGKAVEVIGGACWDRLMRWRWAGYPRPRFLRRR